MNASRYSHSIERILSERTPTSFFEAETILKNQDYDLNLVGNDRLEVDGKEQEVFIYELDDSPLIGFYLYESKEGIYSKVLEPGEDEPSI